MFKKYNFEPIYLSEYYVPSEQFHQVLKHFDLEYLNLCMDQAEQEVLENKIVACILLYGSEYFIEGYHKLS